MDEASRIRRAQTRVEDAREAVRAFHAGVVQDDMALVVSFCASSYDLDAIADEMRRCFAGVQVVGCTSAGEIGPVGYLEHSLAGASFGAGDFTAASGCITGLQEIPVNRSQKQTSSLPFSNMAMQERMQEVTTVSHYLPSNSPIMSWNGIPK